MTPTPLEERVYGTLRRYTSEPTARGILRRARELVAHDESSFESFVDAVMYGARLFVEEPDRSLLVRELYELARSGTGAAAARLRVSDEHSARRARLLVRRLAEDAGASRLSALRAATALSELVRNVLMYAGTGEVAVDVVGDPPRVCVVVSDTGPGIRDVDDVLGGHYVSRTGLGRGLAAVKKLSDHFHIDTGLGGTRVEFEMVL